MSPALWLLVVVAAGLAILVAALGATLRAEIARRGRIRKGWRLHQHRELHARWHRETVRKIWVDPSKDREVLRAALLGAVRRVRQLNEIDEFTEQSGET